MKEEPKNIKVAIIGDAYIVKHIIEFFTTIYKKCIVSDPSINNLIIKRKIENYNNEIYFEIINAGSLTDASQQFKDCSKDDTAFVLAFDKCNNDTFEELKNNVDKIKEFFKGTFMAFAATFEKENGKVLVNYFALKNWVNDLNPDILTYHIHYDNFNILEMLLVNIAIKFLNRKEVTFESLETKLEEEKLPELDNKKLNQKETINIVLLCDENIKGQINSTIMNKSKIFKNFEKLPDSSFSFVMQINDKKQVKLKVSNPESSDNKYSEFDSALLMVYTENEEDSSFNNLKKSFQKVGKDFENFIKVLVEGQSNIGGTENVDELEKYLKLTFGIKCNAFFDQADLDDALSIKNVLKKIAIKVLKKNTSMRNKKKKKERDVTSAA